MKAFARFQNDIWCMNLAYVDKLAEDNNGVKYLLVRQDLFDRTVDAKSKKNKSFQGKRFVHFCLRLQKNRPKKFWVDKGTEFAGDFEKLCKAEGILIYSTMSETKAALAERAIRSLKNTLPLHGRQWIQVPSQNESIRYNTKFLKKLLDRLDTKECKEFRLFVHAVRECTKPKFEIGERVRISKCDSPVKKVYKPQFTKEVYENVAISSKSPPTYTIKDEQNEIIRG